ncbi:DUF4124 domain-containing protein [Janthinobacterium agaricidamnosum]|uniref:DUF4124 domain-containing protein n=1 Tax=Janthinobacterium agaricidamnosum NBRC 102515 = DSM 9628 TaxID=1349767 RepID=W0V227_9BURK|nr:DUF4124 domain-containing protein [Janthinobacterium agaricidamnosum]CDG82879.1 hypothetical protein GJA_2244 [Janthinobacterium agaricidamnosum NBRC 102515 = DSM 9628]
MTFLPVILCLLGIAASAAAQAQTVYRCTAADGKTTFSDLPCAGGKSAVLDVPSAPDKPDNSIMLRQQRVLKQLAGERAQQDKAANAEMERISGVSQAQRKRCASMQLEQQWAREDVAKAAGKDQESLRQKARRGAEKLALECPA